MKVIIKKWGNSAAIRIPAAVIAVAHIGLDQAVDVREEHGRIVIERVRRKVYKLDELLSGINGKNLHKFATMDSPIGKEIW